MTEELQAYRPFFDWELKTGELTPKQRRIARAFRVGRFRQKNDHLTGKPLALHLLHEVYDLHHLVERGSPGCNLLINMVIAAHGPNSNAGKARSRSAIRISNKNKESVLVDETTLLRQRVDYSTGPAPMQVNGDAEPEYRRKMWDELSYGEKTMTKHDAIYDMAEQLGVSPQATRDYYMKATSRHGPFEEYKENGVKRVMVKKDFHLQ